MLDTQERRVAIHRRPICGLARLASASPGDAAHAHEFDAEAHARDIDRAVVRRQRGAEALDMAGDDMGRDRSLHPNALPSV